MSAGKVHMISLGCDKNTVDAEYILGDLIQAGYEITSSPEEADLLIVNTCCFIESATRESLDNIFELASYKNGANKLIVTGCLAERYKEVLEEELPEVDIFLGVKGEKRILSLLGEEEKFEPKRYIKNSPTAYLKISEGCSKNCTYCAIPLIRGPYHSRTPEEILKEARKLEQKGVKELILVAQDLTQYGTDLKTDIDLSKLLKQLSTQFSFEWIRMLYLYPEGITDDLLKTISENKNILPYFDIPIQHTNDRILKMMGRPFHKKDIKQLVSRIREEIPEAILRSTVIVGFPSETEAEFNELLSDLAELKIDRLGAFSYSREEGTPAYDFENQIDEKVKDNRVNKIMSQQYQIMQDQNRKKIGKVYPALVLEKIDAQTYKARLWSEAPEIDLDLYINSKKPIEEGSIILTLIKDIIGYDILGELYESSK